jgi:hypothetical protein
MDRSGDRIQEYRSRDRVPGEMSAEDEAQRYRPRRWQRGLGWARRRDIDDASSQGAAPRGGGRWDPTGEERYAEGLEEFERREHLGRHEFGSYEDDGSRSRYRGRDAGGYSGSAPARWELDEGGVQFGGSPNRDTDGPYRGRGPRGYRRSDDRIREDVCDCLTHAADVDATDIDVQVAEGIVTLSGTVDGRYAKRRSEDIAETVNGVRDVNNQLRVQATEPSGRATRGGS